MRGWASLCSDCFGGEAVFFWWEVDSSGPFNPWKWWPAVLWGWTDPEPGGSDFVLHFWRPVSTLLTLVFVLKPEHMNYGC